MSASKQVSYPFAKMRERVTVLALVALVIFLGLASIATAAIACSAPARRPVAKPAPAKVAPAPAAKPRPTPVAKACPASARYNPKTGGCDRIRV